MGIKQAVITIDAERIIQDASLSERLKSSIIEGIAIIVVLKSNRNMLAVKTTGKITNNNFLSKLIPF